MTSPVSIVLAASTNQNSAGSPLGGSSPASLSRMGSGAPPNATRPTTIAPFFLPSLRDTIGAKVAPSAADANTPSVISPIWRESNPQKKVVK